VERAKRIEEAARAARVETELAVAKAKASDDQAVIAHQQLQIAKLTRQLYGQRSERTVRLLDQMELALEELEGSATEDEIATERAAAKTTNVVAFIRKHPARQPFAEHLSRERVIEPRPTVCLCCGSPRLRKLGEDITETLEVIPRHWKVIQHVREKFTCRDCEKISQAPAPIHVLARGWEQLVDMAQLELRIGTRRLMGNGPPISRLGAVQLAQALQNMPVLHPDCRILRIARLESTIGFAEALKRTALTVKVYSPAVACLVSIARPSDCRIPVPRLPSSARSGRAGAVSPQEASEALIRTGNQLRDAGTMRGRRLTAMRSRWCRRGPTSVISTATYGRTPDGRRKPKPSTGGVGAGTQ
jgi:hypothetical protein